MKIKIDKFGGMLPAIHPGMIGATAAQDVLNSKLASTKAIPMRVPLKDSDAQQTTESFTKYGASWLEFATKCDVRKSLINDDKYSRICWTGDADGKLRHRGTFGTASAVETRKVYVPKPANKVACTVVPYFNPNTIKLIPHFGHDYAMSLTPTTCGFNETTQQWNAVFRYPGSYTTASAVVGGALTVESSYLVFDKCQFMTYSPLTEIGRVKKGLKTVVEIQVVGIAASNEDTTYNPEGATLKFNPCDITVTYNVIYTDAASRYYSITYVDDIGQEGPSSDVSDEVKVYNGDTVQITLPTGLISTLKKIRIYRTAGNPDYADFFFVEEVDVGTASYTDLYEDDELQEVMLRVNNPPEGMSGLCVIGASYAAFKGKDVYFSYPNIPNNWPAKYNYVCENAIVGLAVSGSSVYALTENEPEVLSGSHPESMSQSKIPLRQACASKDSITVCDGQVFYASPDGLIAINEGGAEIVTKNHFSRDQWQALNPATMKCSTHDNRIFIQTAANGLYVFDVNADGLVLSRMEGAFTCFYEDTLNDALYAINGDSEIVKLDGGATNMNAKWRSRLYESPRPVSWSCARVDLSAYTANSIFRIYGNGVLAASRTLTDDKAFRLPVMRREKSWYFEVESDTEIRGIELAQSIGEF